MGAFLGILFAVLFIGSGVFAGMSFYKNSKRKNARNKSVGLIMTALAAVFFALFIFIPFGFVTVNTGEVAVVKVWGDAKEIKTAGLHFRNVISTKYEVYDIKTQQIDSEAYAYSLDGQTLKVTIATQLSVQAGKVLNIAATYGNLDVLKQRISKIAEEKVKVVLAGKSAMDIIATRQTLSPTVLAELKTLETMYFVNVDNFVVVDLEFNSAFENAVEQKMIAEQDKLKAQYDKDKAVIKAQEEAEVKLLEAEARAKAAVEDAKAAMTKAENEAEMIEIAANANAESERIMAQAKADALKLLEEAWEGIDDTVVRAILQAQFYEKWDGVLPTVMSDDISILFPAP